MDNEIRTEKDVAGPGVPRCEMMIFVYQRQTMKLKSLFKPPTIKIPIQTEVNSSQSYLALNIFVIRTK